MIASSLLTTQITPLCRCTLLDRPQSMVEFELPQRSCQECQDCEERLFITYCHHRRCTDDYYCLRVFPSSGLCNRDRDRDHPSQACPLSCWWYSAWLFASCCWDFGLWNAGLPGGAMELCLVKVSVSVESSSPQSRVSPKRKRMRQ